MVKLLLKQWLETVTVKIGRKTMLVSHDLAGDQK